MSILFSQLGMAGSEDEPKFKTMSVKIDTKERFHVITVNAGELSADLAEEIALHVKEIGETGVRNVVLNLSGVSACKPETARALATLQQQAYEEGRSFVICGVEKRLEAVFEQEELLELMNITPTESEAWDIVQMEEIEREMFGDE